jgi:hypothetical protein
MESVEPPRGLGYRRLCLNEEWNEQRIGARGADLAERILRTL